MDKTYNIRCGAPLMLDHEYAHCANTVEFQGFGKEQAISSVYLLLGRPVQLKIPLTDDFKLLVTSPITRKSGKAKAQLMECKLAEDSEEEYEYIRYSDIFEVVITPSLAAESQIEVTDPRLELIYTDMHEHYLELIQHEYTAEQSATAAAVSEANALASANNAASSESAALMSSMNASAASTQAGQRASLALEQALVSEGYAVGKQNGEAVPSTSPYYQNNSEYYADQAAQSAAFLQNVSAEATTLPAGSDATASYDDGVFSFGIPQGIKGDKGDTGDTGIPGVSPQVTVQSILGGHRIIITDSNSISQFDVMDGVRGQQGEQGVGITDIQLTADYGLEITLSNGTVFITSSIRGEQGETGNGIASITKTATVGKVDTYTITYTDGTTTTFDVTNGEVTEASLEEALIDKADVILNTASGTIASFSDGAEMPVKSLEVEINAVQDLHGQSNPYPAGGGVNKLVECVAGTYTSANCTAIVSNDGTITISGTTGSSSEQIIIPLKHSVTLPNEQIYFHLLNTVNASIAPSLELSTDVANTTINAACSPANRIVTVAESRWGVTVDRIRFWIGANVNAGVTLHPMITLTSTATAYAPYENICPISGWDAVNMVRTGKNVFSPIFNDSTGVGVTWTNEGNGIVKVNGTATAFAGKYIGAINLKAGVTYHLKGAVSGKVNFYLYQNRTLINDTGSGANYTPTTDMDNVAVYISVASGVSVDNLLVYPLIEIGTTNDWEPYTADTYPISLGQTVYGGMLEVTGGVQTVTRDIVDLGTLDWISHATLSNVFQANTVGIIPRWAMIQSAGVANAICSNYVMTTSAAGGVDAIDKSIALGTVGSAFIYVHDSAYIDAASFKTAMSGVQLVYELATPTTITLTPTEVTTLLGVNNLWADSGDVAVIYRADTKKYIDGTIVDVPLAMIAPIENGTTASKAYAVGEYFILNGTQFCKAKTAIASGATFTLNTNYTVTTIGAELKALA